MSKWKRYFAIAVFVAGCGGNSEKPADSGIVDRSVPGLAPAAPDPITPGEAKTSGNCQHDGRWALCSVENRLRQSGFVAKPVEGKPLRRAGFSVEPIVYTLGKSRLEVFIYKDAASLAREIALLDTLRVAPLGDTTTRWDTQPVLIRSANLAAVLLSTNVRQVERVALALTAGAPQRGSPR